MKLNELLNNVKVEWKTLGEVCISLPKGTLKTTQLLDDGYPVINSGRDLYGYYSQFNNEKNAFTIAARGEYAGFINFMSSKFWAGGLCYPYRSKDENKLLTKFIFYFLKRQEQNIMDTLVAKGSIPAINKSDCDKIQIPIPPLEIQEKIAKILDKFTNYATELRTELRLRNKQYEYYRNLLLSKEFLENMCVKFDDEAAGGRLETKMLGELLDYEQPTKYIVKDTNYNDEFSIPVLTAGQTFILGYTDEKENIYKSNKENPVIIFDDFTTANKWVDFNFKAKSSAMKILKPKNKSINLRYCYFYMQTLNVDITEHKRMWISEYSKQEILYPPLKVQNEVVVILDKFSDISSNLEKGLPKEIDLRQKQYEFYRDLLLNFKKD